MMKTILLTCLLILFSITGIAQNKTLDSLKHELAVSKPDTNRVWVLNGLLNLYKFYIPDSAFFFGQQELDLARQIKFPKGEIHSLYLLAITYRALGNSSKALELELKSIQIADKNNLMYEKANALVGLGYIYLQSQNYSKALFYLHQALKLLELYPGNNGLIGINLNDLADTYLSMNKLDSAEYYSFLTTNYIKQYNVYWVRAANLRTIAGIYNKKGETQLAIDFLLQSLKYNSNSVTSSFDSCQSNFEIANIYQKANRMDSAIYYAQKSLFNAQQVKSYSYIESASSLLAQLYESKDAQKAIAYNKITIAAQDSLLNFNKINSYKNILEFDEKERQYEINTAQTAYKTKIRQYVLVTGLGVFLLIAFILFRNNKKQQKANKFLHQQKEEINATLSQLKSTQAQLIQSEKMASLGELTAGIAHEIQNPLNFVNNFSDVNTELIADAEQALDKGNMDEAKSILADVKENEQKINHHGRRADAIVKGMLQHSRKNTGKKEPTDINALADEYLRLSYHGLRAKDKSFNVTIETHFDPEVGKVNVVGQDIGRVLLNLFNNAFYAVNEKRKQSREGYEPVVSVTTRKEKDKAVIIVKDNGIGIPEKVLDKIYQPFFTTKPSGEGTGLGLSMSYEIITKGHNGTIKIDSREGEYSIFTIELPLE